MAVFGKRVSLPTGVTSAQAAEQGAVPKPPVPQLQPGGDTWREESGKFRHSGVPLSDAALPQPMARGGDYSEYDSLHLKHVFPPQLPLRSLSFLGGAPIAPAGFVWPRRREDGVPLTFLGQINCADMPDYSQRRLFPADGVIYYFMDWRAPQMGEVDADVGPVIYVPTDLSDWVEIGPPEDLPQIEDLGGIEGGYLHARPDLADQTGWSLYPKVEVSIGRVMDAEERDWSNEHERKILQDQRVEQYSTFHGPLLDRHTLKSWTLADQKGFYPPYPDFPRNWLAVEMVAGRIISRCKDVLSTVEYSLRTRGPDDRPFHLVHGAQAETLTSVAGSIVADCEAAMIYARKMGRMTLLTDEDRAEFWSDLEELAQRGSALMIYTRPQLSRSTIQDRCILFAALRSAETALSDTAQAASQFDDLIEDLRPRHSIMSSRYSMGYVHKIGGIPRDAQDATSVYQETHILLMQFDVDDGLEWMWGDCGVMQFWLTPDDLVARRFDKAEISFSSS